MSQPQNSAPKNFKPRNILEVFDQMREHIPENHCLREYLAEIDSSVRYTAPEAFWILWQRAGEALGECFPVMPKSGWELEVVNIFLDKKGETRGQAV